jgi:hypothetical protein
MTLTAYNQVPMARRESTIGVKSTIVVEHDWCQAFILTYFGGKKRRRLNASVVNFGLPWLYLYVFNIGKC